jgi:hypothetical protein
MQSRNTVGSSVQRRQRPFVRSGSSPCRSTSRGLDGFCDPLCSQRKHSSLLWCAKLSRRGLEQFDPSAKMALSKTRQRKMLADDVALVSPRDQYDRGPEIAHSGEVRRPVQNLLKNGAQIRVRAHAVVKGFDHGADQLLSDSHGNTRRFDTRDAQTSWRASVIPHGFRFLKNSTKNLPPSTNATRCGMSGGIGTVSPADTSFEPWCGGSR